MASKKSSGGSKPRKPRAPRKPKAEAPKQPTQEQLDLAAAEPADGIYAAGGLCGDSSCRSDKPSFLQWLSGKVKAFFA